MTIKVTSDSTCDLPAHLLEAHAIHVFPLYIIKEEQAFRDGAEIVPQDIFDHVAAGGTLCTTSAVNLADYMDKFGQFSRRYDAVIHVNLSSEISCCHQNARLAAAEFPNVYVVDSQSLTTGHGYVALKAAELAESGMAAAEIVRALDDLIPRINASFILNRLDYLRKGGRCSSVTALGANLLKLKPCIEVSCGTMGVGKKYRGEFQKCIRAYLTDRLTKGAKPSPQRIFIGCCDIDEETMQMAESVIRECIEVKELIRFQAGCTITCHCGPGTLGLIFEEQ